MDILFTKRPWIVWRSNGRKGYFASEFLACNFKDGKASQDLRAAVVQFNEYLDMNGSENPYFFGVYYPELRS